MTTPHTDATEPHDGDASVFDGAFELRSFGRRRGRKLSSEQQRLLDSVLPRVALDLSTPADMRALFATAEPRAVWLEIGFGGAEHLIAQASANPDVGLIGCEPFEEGVIKALGGIAGGALANVRIHPDDARDILRWLPAASIDRAFILFPDPWPKRKHQKRRLVNRQTLALVARVMKAGAELRIGTDIGDYVRSMMVEIASEGSFEWSARGPGDWRNRPADWPETRYEQKAGREGRRCYYFSFRRR